MQACYITSTSPQTKCSSAQELSLTNHYSQCKVYRMFSLIQSSSIPRELWWKLAIKQWHRYLSYKVDKKYCKWRLIMWLSCLLIIFAVNFEDAFPSNFFNKSGIGWKCSLIVLFEHFIILTFYSFELCKAFVKSFQKYFLQRFLEVNSL